MEYIDKLIERHEDWIRSCEAMIEEGLEDPEKANLEISLHKVFIIELKQLKTRK